MSTDTLLRTDTSATAIPGEPPGLGSMEVAMMGGRVGVHLQPTGVLPAGDASTSAAGTDTAPSAAAAATLRRIEAWAARLTRFTTTSELSCLNADPRAEVFVGPTLAAVLDWSRYAEGLTDGIVDIGLLDARLAAEGIADCVADRHARGRASRASRSWSLQREARGAVVRRPAGLRFDLDGVGKGWLADRALDGLGRYRAAVVDADGDVAIALAPGVTWWFGIADPRRASHDLALLCLTARSGPDGGDGRFGLATSGTSVHRWDGATGPAHHLIDPRTGRPATTDVVQATVLARTAREAEALAKSVVILGVAAGYALLQRVGVDGAVLLTDRDELVMHPATMRWLA